METKQKDLFSDLHFHGPGYVKELDQERLTGQAKDIFHLMKDGVWRTLREISAQHGHPEASVSAMLRMFRRKSMGANTVNKRRRGNPTDGLWEYQLILNKLSTKVAP